MILGLSSCSVVGIRVFVLSMSLCTGEPILSFSGVFRYSSKSQIYVLVVMHGFLDQVLDILLFLPCHLTVGIGDW